MVFRPRPPQALLRAVVQARTQCWEGEQPGSRTAEGIIKQETVGRTPGGSDAQSSWLERFFSPEKTMDLAIAGIGGYAEAGMRKWELEYPEKVKRRDAAEPSWVPEMSVLAPPFVVEMRVGRLQESQIPQQLPRLRHQLQASKRYH